MKIQNIVSATLFTLATTLSPFACAQSPSGSLEVETKVPFEFTVSKKLYPSGTYTVVRNTSDRLFLRLNGEGQKHLVSMMILTRLARQHTADAPKASLVFDVVNNQHYLSEVWMPGVDGYQVGSTSQAHKHELVEVRE